MLLFYGLPIYVFHTYLIDFSFLKIRNGNHNKLPISKPSHWLHEISISKIVCHHFQPGLISHYELGVLIQISIHQMGGGATHVLFSFFWVTMSHFDWPITKKLYLGGSPNQKSIGGWTAFPLDEKEKNFGRSIWNKSVRTYWGTCWELGKPLGSKKN